MEGKRKKVREETNNKTRTAALYTRVPASCSAWLFTRSFTCTLYIWLFAAVVKCGHLHNIWDVASFSTVRE